MRLQVYMGWDPREAEAFDVAEHSILSRNASADVIALKLDDLRERGILTRPVERTPEGKLWCPISEAPMSTEFAISRFSVPFLQDSGWAVFMDCDVLLQADIAELFALADPKYAVMVVKHEQKVHPLQTKMDGQAQTAYARKNWSSVMLWNLDHTAHKRLTLEMLNTLPGRDLHRFCWLKDEEIGSLPPEWNVLAEPVQPKLIHYTLGGPWFSRYSNCAYSLEWEAERAEMGIMR